MHRLRSSLSYLIAVLISSATLGLIASLPVEDNQVSLVLLLTAVVVSAWVCGWRAGLLATAICAITHVFMHVTSEQDLMLESVRITAFLSLSLLILTLSVLRQEAEDSLTKSELRLRAILDHSRDPISVSHNGSHQFVNPAYLKLFGIRSENDLAGTSVLDVVAIDSRPEVLRRLNELSTKDRTPAPFEVQGMRRDGTRIDLKVYLSAYDHAGQELVLTILRDVTERNRALREKEHLISDLRDALSKVKELRGLLPTCASCKKIRDEEGAWHDMETYICEHSEADFSHGLCPCCAERLYPEVFGPDAEDAMETSRS